MNLEADGTYFQHTRATLRLALPNSDSHITYTRLLPAITQYQQPARCHYELAERIRHR
jgi:hypothetical protein